MHVLYRKQNFRNIKLENAQSGETVGVLCRDGSIQYCHWLGLISRKEARALPGMRPVKLKISRVDNRDLSDDEYVQGCLTLGGVYAVVDSEVIIVKAGLY